MCYSSIIRLQLHLRVGPPHSRFSPASQCEAGLALRGRRKRKTDSSLLRLDTTVSLSSSACLVVDTLQQKAQKEERSGKQARARACQDTEVRRKVDRRGVSSRTGDIPYIHAGVAGESARGRETQVHLPELYSCGIRSHPSLDGDSAAAARRDLTAQKRATIKANPPN